MAMVQLVLISFMFTLYPMRAEVSSTILDIILKKFHHLKRVPVAHGRHRVRVLIVRVRVKPSPTILPPIVPVILIPSSVGTRGDGELCIFR